MTAEGAQRTGQEGYVHNLDTGASKHFGVQEKYYGGLIFTINTIQIRFIRGDDTSYLQGCYLALLL